MSNPISIIAFAGPAGSGKDTAGAYLIKKYGFQRLPMAGPLKAMLAAMGYPEPATQDEKEKIIPELGVSWRYMAQTLGTEWGRSLISPDLWVILAEKHIRATGGRWVITDCRFENEATMVRGLNGVIGRLRGRAHDMSKDTKTHASEAGITAHQHDVIIDNTPVQDVLRRRENVEDSYAKLYRQLDNLVRYVGVQ